MTPESSELAQPWTHQVALHHCCHPDGLSSTTPIRTPAKALTSHLQGLTSRLTNKDIVSPELTWPHECTTAANYIIAQWSRETTWSDY